MIQLIVDPACVLCLKTGCFSTTTHWDQRVVPSFLFLTSKNSKGRIMHYVSPSLLESIQRHCRWDLTPLILSFFLFLLFLDKKDRMIRSVSLCYWETSKVNSRKWLYTKRSLHTRHPASRSAPTETTNLFSVRPLLSDRSTRSARWRHEKLGMWEDTMHHPLRVIFDRWYIRLCTNTRIDTVFLSTTVRALKTWVTREVKWWMALTIDPSSDFS